LWRTSDNMHDLRTRPDPREPLRDEPPVALFGHRLTTQEAARFLREEGPVEAHGNIPFIHQGFKPHNIAAPVMVFAVRGENIIIRSKRREMKVLAVREMGEEVGEIALLGEARQLPARTEADVHQPLNAMLTKQGKEPLGGLLREPDGVEFQFIHPTYRRLNCRWIS